MRVPGREALVTLAVAFGWGQLKIELTLWFGGQDWPWWGIRGGCYAVAILVTLMCYRSTNWLIERIKRGPV